VRHLHGNCAGLGLIAGCATLVFGGLLTPTSVDQFPWFVGVMLATFSSPASATRRHSRQYPVVFSHSPRQAAGVIGFSRRHRRLWPVPVFFFCSDGRRARRARSASPSSFGLLLLPACRPQRSTGGSTPAREPKNPADFSMKEASTKAPCNTILTLSTVGFTLMFAVWLMFGVLGIPIRKEFGLSDNDDLRVADGDRAT